MSYRPSGGDKELARAVRRAGTRVTERQIWRWRRVGLIPRPTRHFLGKGRGSRSVYPQGTVEQIVELTTILRENRRLSDAALILFARGWPLDPLLVKRAYIERLLGLAAYVDHLGGPPEVVHKDERTERAGLAILSDPRMLPIRRAFRAQLQQRRMTSREALLSAIDDWILLYSHGDEAAAEAPSDEFLAAMGQDGEWSLPVPREEVLRRMNAVSWARLVNGAAAEQLLLARNGTKALSDGMLSITGAIVESKVIRATYGERAQMRSERDFAQRARWDLYMAGLFLGMLLMLDYEGDSRFREAIASFVLILELVAAYHRGGEEEIRRRVDDVLELVEEVKERL